VLLQVRPAASLTPSNRAHGHLSTISPRPSFASGRRAHRTTAVPSLSLSLVQRSRRRRAQPLVRGPHTPFAHARLQQPLPLQRMVKPNPLAPGRRTGLPARARRALARRHGLSPLPVPSPLVQRRQRAAAGGGRRPRRRAAAAGVSNRGHDRAPSSHRCRARRRPPRRGRRSCRACLYCSAGRRPCRGNSARARSRGRWA
jgi:hypothetical protein